MTTTRAADLRRAIAVSAREVLAGTRALVDFLQLARASDDPAVARLADVITQEPAGADRCGVGNLALRQHRAKLEHAIEALEDGQPDARPRDGASRREVV